MGQLTLPLNHGLRVQGGRYIFRDTSFYAHECISNSWFQSFTWIAVLIYNYQLSLLSFALNMPGQFSLKSP